MDNIDIKLNRCKTGPEKLVIVAIAALFSALLTPLILLSLSSSGIGGNDIEAGTSLMGYASLGLIYLIMTALLLEISAFLFDTVKLALRGDSWGS